MNELEIDSYAGQLLSIKYVPDNELEIDSYAGQLLSIKYVPDNVFKVSILDLDLDDCADMPIEKEEALKLANFILENVK